MRFRRWTASVLLAGALSVSTITNASSVSGQGTWETTLQGRDLDGNLATAEAYYDTALNITWLADLNFAQTSGYDSDGMMSWSSANAWVANLNPYGSGITGWQLPTVTDTGAPLCDFAYSGTDCGYNVDVATSAMAHMFYITLGNKAYYDTSGTGQPDWWRFLNTGPFSNSPGFGYSFYYWSGTNYLDGYLDDAWQFFFFEGSQGHFHKSFTLYAWPVHSGDVGASMVPLPTAVWLFCSGLMVLAVVCRRYRPLPRQDKCLIADIRALHVA